MSDEEGNMTSGCSFLLKEGEKGNAGFSSISENNLATQNLCAMGYSGSQTLNIISFLEHDM